MIAFMSVALLFAAGAPAAADTPLAPVPLKPPKHGGVYVVAHRGAHIGIPENTLPAYAKAIELGADFVEIDVRTTKDGHFVSIHNSTIEDYVPGAKGPIRSFTLEELRQMDIGSRVGPEWKDTRIPTFEEILDLCKGKIGVYLDLKDADVGKLVPLIQERGMEHDVLWYIGGGAVKRLHEICPECVEMPDPGPEQFLAKLLEGVHPRVVASVRKHFSKSFADACHAAGAIVIVDDNGPECWQDMLDWGADGIQADRPEQLIRFLEERPKK